MPTEPSPASRPDSGRIQIAELRILRLALGTALSMWVSQAVAWPLSFFAPIVTMFILALPLPALRLKAGIAFVLALSLSLSVSLLLLPALLNHPAVGILLLALALFWSFYLTARGGSPVLGTFLTAGIAVSTAVGTVSLDGVIMLVKGFAFAACVGVSFVWVAHALLPDSSADPGAAAPAAGEPGTPARPDLVAARRSAWRSLLIVFPVSLWLVLSSASAAYVPVMIKVATMGQQATRDATRGAGRSLMASTLIGGFAAVLGWQVLSVYPSLILYTLLVALAGLVMGSRIFRGPGMHPQGSTWSYAYLTMLAILGPAVLDGAAGAGAGVKFWDRLIMFAGTTLYGVGCVYVFDAFWPQRPSAAASLAPAN